MLLDIEKTPKEQENEKKAIKKKLNPQPDTDTNTIGVRTQIC